MFRGIILRPATVVFAAVSVKKSDDAPPNKNDRDDKTHYKCKRSDLPLYTPLHAYNRPKQEPHAISESQIEKVVEGGIRVVRTELQCGYATLSDHMKVLDDYYEVAKNHTQSTIDMLNEPQNTMHRSGAIAIGGLAGFIFAARGGFIKKVLYTTIGAGAIASLCYPREAEAFARDALLEARKGYAIAFNFVKGVKPGDDNPTDSISNFPTNLKDLKVFVQDLYDETKGTLFGKKDK